MTKFATLIFLSIVSVTLNAQDVTVEKMNPDQYVFWISVKAQMKISKETRKEVYDVRSNRKKPQDGTVRNYERYLFKSVKGGRHLPVGPFLEFDDAVRATDMYKLARHTSKSIEEEIRNFVDTSANFEYYWFFLKFKIAPRTGKFILKRTAARVASGDLKDFKQVLWEGLFFKQLAIGPFTSQVEAEEAKRLYRLEED